jgi:hypothetical protein
VVLGNRAAGARASLVESIAAQHYDSRGLILIL